MQYLNLYDHSISSSHISILKKAWAKHYGRIGLGREKLNAKVKMRIRKGKMPSIP